MDEQRVEHAFPITVIEKSDSRCAAIRLACLTTAKLILKSTPRCADQSNAIRQLRQVMRTAQDAVLTKGEV